MTERKTELASVEEHDNSVRKAIERRAFTLYELDGLKDGHDLEHWFRAERELTIQDVPFSIENDAVTVRLALEDFPASTLVISISARSVLIFSLDDDANGDRGGMNRELLRLISLLCVAKLASAPEIRDFSGRPLQSVDRTSLPSSRSISVAYRGGVAAVSFAQAYGCRRAVL